MWGQVIYCLLKIFLSGIIPTRVGTSPKSFNIFSISEDHPHACGDKKRNVRYTKKELGSSPRVWGQESPLGGFGYCFRIIPTRVGTRLITANVFFPLKDHPHACGDKISFFSGIVSSPGSSPRVWGQGQVVLDRLKKEGIIPTRVGTRYFIFHLLFSF